MTPLREAVLAKLVRARTGLDELRRYGDPDMGAMEWQKGYIKALEEALDLEGLTLRRYPRRPTSIPVEIGRGSGEAGKGTIMDVSAGGCALATPLALSVGELVRLVFTLPEPPTPFALEGWVRRAQRTGEEVGAGVEFAAVPAEMREALEAFLALPQPER
ncbi:MAG: PilZ domain-containing protein [Candidatus Rokubacteria bacterium]|nr:PilZ domain-containing protein [Candidatus Rokubacteria bacterium]